MEQLKGLYIRKPWDYLILEGLPSKKTGENYKKDIEIRTYPRKFRGTIAILGTTIDKYATNYLSNYYILPLRKRVEQEVQCIMGLVDIIDWRKLSYEEFCKLQPRHMNAIEWYSEKVHGAFLTNPRPITPIPYKPFGLRGRITVNLPNELIQLINKR